ncbi:hypothetical protein OJ252_3673 [Cryptosporidium canis]|uniref:Uncharacterized protein n=1 Tax=Cryptosporidium canis TaxID=195482 RepID=A0ABQ8P1M8_9CRYT|nr:hypothetical protein OJ252_3673 [Cryptosporidium canis]
MASTDSLDSSSASEFSDENSLFFEEGTPNGVAASDDSLGDSVSELDEEELGLDISGLSSSDESISGRTLLEPRQGPKEGEKKRVNANDGIDSIFRVSADGEFFSSAGFSADLKDKVCSDYSIEDLLVLEPYLHYDEEFDSKDGLQLDRTELLGDLRRRSAGAEHGLAVNGNRQIFQNGSIDLQYSHLGHPSAVYHDSSGLVFLGTIRGFCLIYLETDSAGCVVVDPINGLSSRITSISTSRSEDKALLFLSLATVDGDLHLWRLDVTKIKELLVHKCVPETRPEGGVSPRDSRDSPRCSVCISGRAPAYHVKSPTEPGTEREDSGEALALAEREAEGGTATLLKSGFCKSAGSAAERLAGESVRDFAGQPTQQCGRPPGEQRPGVGSPGEDLPVQLGRGRDTPAQAPPSPPTKETGPG